MDKMSKIFKENKLNIYLLVKYVDDVNIATALAEEGSTWRKEGQQ